MPKFPAEIEAEIVDIYISCHELQCVLCGHASEAVHGYIELIHMHMPKMSHELPFC